MGGQEISPTWKGDEGINVVCAFVCRETASEAYFHLQK